MLTGELTTALTNVVLASVAAALALRTGAWLSGTLFAACISAGAGALFHGLRDTAPALLLLVLWKVVLVGLASTSALLVLATLRRAAVSPSTRRLVCIVTLTKLAITLAFCARSNSVTPAGVDFILTLLLVAALEWRRRVSDDQSRWSLIAVAVTLVALGLQASGFRHGLPYSHNDAFHLLQAVALGLFFLGLRVPDLDRTKLIR